MNVEALENEELPNAKHIWEFFFITHAITSALQDQ